MPPPSALSTPSPDPARRQKVCMVTYLQSPRELPPLQHEAESLAREGFEVVSLSFAGSAAVPRLENHAPGFTTRRFRLRTRAFFHALFGHATSNKVVSAVQYALTFAEYLTKALVHAWRERAAVYEAHDLPALLPALLAARLRGRPVIYRAHEIWSETHAHVPFARFWRFLDQRLVPRCDEVVTPDENRSRIYLEEYGARRMPLTIKNCPPFKEPLQSSLLRDELQRRGVACSTVALYQGLIESGRCIEEIAEASRLLDPGVVLVVLGPGFGPWSDPATRLAPYDRIVVLPPVPYQELARYTASADLGILLYRNDCRNNYYCAPNKIFEYMMMGLPSIAANHPGMKAIVEGEGVGACVDPESPQEIAAAINRLAADPALRQRMKETGLRLAREKYSWQVESRPLLERHRALAAAGAEARAAG